MDKHTAKRKRRRAKAKLRNPASVRPHKRKTGRTGNIFRKRLRAVRLERNKRTKHDGVPVSGYPKFVEPKKIVVRPPNTPDWWEV